MTIRWPKNAAAAVIAGFIGFVLGLTWAGVFTLSLFVFALLCGLDYTAPGRVRRKGRDER